DPTLTPIRGPPSARVQFLDHPLHPPRPRLWLLRLVDRLDVLAAVRRRQPGEGRLRRRAARQGGAGVLRDRRLGGRPARLLRAGGVAVVGPAQPGTDLAVDVRRAGDGDAVGDAVLFRPPARVEQAVGEWLLAQGQAEVEARLRGGLELGEDVLAV